MGVGVYEALAQRRRERSRPPARRVALLHAPQRREGTEDRRLVRARKHRRCEQELRWWSATSASAECERIEQRAASRPQFFVVCRAAAEDRVGLVIDLMDTDKVYKGFTKAEGIEYNVGNFPMAANSRAVRCLAP